MSSTSTNKQPLLIDRPLLAIARLDATSHPLGPPDPGSATNGVLLIDCTGSSDGALIDTMFLIQRIANDETVVNAYISSSNSTVNGTNSSGAVGAWFIGSCKFQASAPVGAHMEFPLPFTLAPVAHAGANLTLPVGGSASAATPPRLRALMIPRGMALWAAVSSAGAVGTAPLIACQGGWY